MNLDNILKVLRFPFVIGSELERFKKDEISLPGIRNQIITGFLTTIFVVTFSTVFIMNLLDKNFFDNREINCNYPGEELAVINTKMDRFVDCKFNYGKVGFQINEPHNYNFLYNLIKSNNKNSLAVIDIDNNNFEDFILSINNDEPNTIIPKPVNIKYPLEMFDFVNKDLVPESFEVIKFKKNSKGKWQQIKILLAVNVCCPFLHQSI